MTTPLPTLSSRTRAQKLKAIFFFQWVNLGWALRDLETWILKHKENWGL